MWQVSVSLWIARCPRQLLCIQMGKGLQGHDGVVRPSLRLWTWLGERGLCANSDTILKVLLGRSLLHSRSPLLSFLCGGVEGTATPRKVSQAVTPPWDHRHLVQEAPKGDGDLAC